MKLKRIPLCMILVLALITASLTLVYASVGEIKEKAYTVLDSGKGVLGDVTDDNKVSIRDATIIQMYITNLQNFSYRQKILADVNQDGKVNILDVTYIQMYDIEYQLALRIGEYVDIPQEETTQPTQPTTDGGWLPGYFD